MFGDLADVFAPAQKKSESAQKVVKPGLPQKSKQVAVLDGQKSQNMNIMLAKFGSRRKISEIIQVRYVRPVDLLRQERSAVIATVVISTAPHHVWHYDNSPFIQWTLRIGVAIPPYPHLYHNPSPLTCFAGNRNSRGALLYAAVRHDHVGLHASLLCRHGGGGGHYGHSAG